MNASDAKTIAMYTLNGYAREFETNKRVIAAVPAGQESYTPHEKYMNALALAWHIASADLFFLNGVINGEFAKGGEPGVPENIKCAADVLAWYDANVPPAVEKLKSMSGEDLAKIVDFYGMMQAPAAVYLSLMEKHSVHHRGQLSTYLRPMGAKVPGIYGPSGDSK